jgi:hypothetical protein
MKKLLLTANVAIIFLFFSCSKEAQWDCTKSTGKIITKTITPQDYKVLEINSLLNITLVQDSQNFIKITGGENLLPKVKFEYNYPYLRVSDNNTCRWIRNYKKEMISVEFHFTTLDSVIAYRENNLKSDGYIRNKVFMVKYPTSSLATLNLKIDVDSFYLKINPASGDYYVEGSCKYNYIYSIGYSYVHTENLHCLNAEVFSYETGDIYVSPSENLYAHIFNFGNIYYCKPVNKITIEKPDYAHGKVIYKQCSDI